MIWKVYETNQRLQSNLSQTMGITPLFAQLLINRGMKTPEEAAEFLFGDFDSCYDPFLLKDMDKAVQRVSRALSKKEKILIYGDYDVDGVTSTALLAAVLRQLGADCETFIPNRLEDGYGLNIRAVAKARNLGVNLIITVDCGINSVKEVECARNYGIDVIITDHHEVKGDERPEACATIDPHQSECLYPFKYLAGVGVAYKLARALCTGREDIADKHLDLVALGTVADIVKQTGENRILTKTGMKKLQMTEKPGLRALMDISGVDPEKLTCRSIGFSLGPRINAMGRVGDASKALELFLCEDLSKANELAKLLETENRNRQAIERDILKVALERAKNEFDLEKDNVIVLADEAWHPGVIGIVASRLTEVYSKPAILIALDGDKGKGSGRGVPGFNLFEAINMSKEYLEAFGGHEQACGVRISKENVEKFRNAINNASREFMLNGEELVPELMIDLKLPFSSIGLKLINELSLLMPYGPGNREPVFASHGLKVKNNPRFIGKSGFKFQAACGNLCCEALTFRKNEVNKPKIGDTINLAYTPSINSWRGIDNIQLNIKGLEVLGES